MPLQALVKSIASVESNMKGLDLVDDGKQLREKQHHGEADNEHLIINV